MLVSYLIIIALHCGLQLPTVMAPKKPSESLVPGIRSACFSKDYRTLKVSLLLMNTMKEPIVISRSPSTLELTFATNSLSSDVWNKARFKAYETRLTVENDAREEVTIAPSHTLPTRFELSFSESQAQLLHAGAQAGARCTIFVFLQVCYMPDRFGNAHDHPDMYGPITRQFDGYSLNPVLEDEPNPPQRRVSN